MLPNLQYSQSCHICDTHKQQLRPQSYSLCANKPRCNKLYCMNCIKKYFVDIYSPNTFNPQKWVCYVCQNKCNCNKCRQSQSLKYFESYKNLGKQYNQNFNMNKQDKLIGQKQQVVRKVLQFNIHDLDQQKDDKSLDNIDLNDLSDEYIPDQFIKVPEKHKQTPSLFYTFKDQSPTPLDYSSQIQIPQQRKSKTIIKSKKQRNFVGLKVQKIPPYLESIMKRKQIFRNFMIQHSKKSFQQLVKEEIQSRKQKIGFQFMESNNMPSPVMKTQSININSTDLLVSPTKIPETPSFLPVSEPLTPISSGFKISDLLNQKLKQYEMEDDDLSIELL